MSVYCQVQVTVCVRCERTVPLYAMDSIFKKSSVIVTRRIQIDMDCTEPRRRLYDALTRRHETRSVCCFEELTSTPRVTNFISSRSDSMSPADCTSFSIISRQWFLSFPRFSTCQSRLEPIRVKFRADRVSVPLGPIELR